MTAFYVLNLTFVKKKNVIRKICFSLSYKESKRNICKDSLKQDSNAQLGDETKKKKQRLKQNWLKTVRRQAGSGKNGQVRGH